MADYTAANSDMYLSLSTIQASRARLKKLKLGVVCSVQFSVFAYLYQLVKYLTVADCITVTYFLRQFHEAPKGVIEISPC